MGAVKSNSLLLAIMFRLALLSALIAVTLGASPRPYVPMLDGRIVGGEPTTIEEIPYQVSVQMYGSHFCGGSIISPTRVLTAAHCTDRRSSSQLGIRAGSSIRGQGGQVINVISICQHPSYNRNTIDNDVSVLILESAIELGSGAQPVSLNPEGADVLEGTEATVSGWGTLSSGGSSPRQLQKVEVPKVSQESCKSAYGSSAITDSMICFGLQKGGKDSCQGDSGGPLVSNGIQLGVVSWGAGCAEPRYPGVYAAVAVLRDHIDSC